MCLCFQRLLLLIIAWTKRWSVCCIKCLYPKSKAFTPSFGILLPLSWLAYLQILLLSYSFIFVTCSHQLWIQALPLNIEPSLSSCVPVAFYQPTIQLDSSWASGLTVGAHICFPFLNIALHNRLNALVLLKDAADSGSIFSPLALWGGAMWCLVQL